MDIDLKGGLHLLAGGLLVANATDAQVSLALEKFIRLRKQRIAEGLDGITDVDVSNLLTKLDDSLDSLEAEIAAKRATRGS